MTIVMHQGYVFSGQVRVDLEVYTGLLRIAIVAIADPGYCFSLFYRNSLPVV